MNSEWRNFLERAGATAKEDRIPEAGSGNHGVENFLTDLSRLDLLEFEGKDALEFLNGQFTSDLTQLPVGAFQYSAWCNPQGRVIAVFIIYHWEQSFFLLIPEEIKDRFLKRLQLYVLRAEVVIRDRSNDLVRLGIIAGEGAEDIPALPGSPGTLMHGGDLTLLRIENGPPLRVLVVGTVDRMQSLWQSLAPKFEGTSAGLWCYHDINAGIPWVLDPTCEQFLPQELNLDVTGGLSYAKGCFPGQEVIARIHYRGAVKQRLHRADIPADTQQPIPGDKLYAADTENSIGTIINTANSGHGTIAILAVVEIDKAANNNLHLAGKHGMPIKFEAVDW